MYKKDKIENINSRSAIENYSNLLTIELSKLLKGLKLTFTSIIKLQLFLVLSCLQYLQRLFNQEKKVRQDQQEGTKNNIWPSETLKW